MAKPAQCFISYAHDDHKGFDRLLIHVKPLAELYDFEIWHDQRIHSGDYWSRRVEKEIGLSDVFICFVTNAFLGSDYIRKHELPAMIERHEQAGALLVPVIYKESCWRSYFGNFIEVVPKQNRCNIKPIRSWRDPEEGFAVAANAIGASIEDWFDVKPKTYFKSSTTGACP